MLPVVLCGCETSETLREYECLKINYGGGYLGLGGGDIT